MAFRAVVVGLAEKAERVARATCSDIHEITIRAGIKARSIEHTPTNTRSAVVSTILTGQASGVAKLTSLVGNLPVVAIRTLVPALRIAAVNCVEKGCMSP